MKVRPGLVDLRAHAVLQKACATGDGGTVDRACHGADKRSGNPLVIYHRELAGFRLAGAKARQRAFGGAGTDLFRRIQILAEHRCGVVIIALHRAVLLGDDDGGNALRGAAVIGRESVAGGDHHMGGAMACRTTFGVGDPLDRKGRALGGKRAVGQLRGARHGLVIDFDLRNVTGDFISAGHPDIGIFRRHLGHRHGALGQHPDVFGSSWLVETEALRLPTKTRSAASTSSARSLASTLPRRTETELPSLRATPASAPSAPAAIAASRSSEIRCSSSLLITSST